MESRQMGEQMIAISNIKHKSLIFMVGFSLLFARGFDAIGKVPADPGFDRVFELRRMGLPGILSVSNGYRDVSAHIGPFFTLFFPLRFSGVILSLTTLIAVAIISMLIFDVVLTERGSAMIAAVSTLIFILTPAFSESTIGNYGSLKWPLFTLLAVMYSSEKYLETHRKTAICVAIVAGLSNPFALLAIPRQFLDLLKRRNLRTNLASVVLVGSMFEVMTWFQSGAPSHVYFDMVYRPWPGMGMFWWWIWISPLVFSTLVLAYVASVWRNRSSTITYAGWLALSALVLWLLMYWEAGIKDSTAVATCSLSSIALLIAVHSLKPMKIQRLLFVGAVGSFALLSIPWFSAGWYLTDTPTWSTEIARLQSDCEHLGVQRGEVLIQTTHIEFTCDEIGKWG